MVFSLFTVFELLADALIYWVPLFYVAKLCFVIWLQAPQTKGATVLLVQYVTPLLRKHEHTIDSALERGYRRGEMTFQDVRARFRVKEEELQDVEAERSM